MMNTGSGHNRADAQREADDLRANPGTAARWDRAQWIRFALACIPIAAFIVVGILFL
ncbi:MAG: hypothetical protein JWN62_4538 [Acidimicrobiales bacterium]|nr:hypothetical protein [Acidimicrobiales bacterium]